MFANAAACVILTIVSPTGEIGVADISGTTLAKQLSVFSPDWTVGVQAGNVMDALLFAGVESWENKSFAHDPLTLHFWEVGGLYLHFEM